MKSNIPYEIIDYELIPLIKMINQHPSFQTTLSCAGHVKRCLGEKKAVIPPWTTDDIGSRRLEEVQRHNCDDFQQKYCSFTTQPFLQFKCNDRGLFIFLIDELNKNIPKDMPQVTTVPHDSKVALIKKFSDPLVYAYGNGDEGYPHEEYPEDRTTHHFQSFWLHFLQTWSKIVAPLTDDQMMQLLPTRFDRDNKICSTCQVEKTKKINYLFTEGKMKRKDRTFVEVDLFALSDNSLKKRIKIHHMVV